MNLIHSANGFITLNFERGEEVIAGLKDFLKQGNISAGHITGLGAASRLELAYYNLETKEYERKVFTDDVEILSLTGNIGQKEDGELVVHMHGAFGQRDFSVFGGHIFELVISGAGEIHIASLPGFIKRAYDDETGLTLMCPIE